MIPPQVRLVSWACERCGYEVSVRPVDLDANVRTHCDSAEHRRIDVMPERFVLFPKLDRWLR